MDEAEKREIITAELQKALQMADAMRLQALIACFIAILYRLNDTGTLPLNEAQSAIENLLDEVPMEEKQAPFGITIKQVLATLEEDPKKSRMAFFDIIPGGPPK